MRRVCESGEIEFSNRYTLDEARFNGGQERICNKENKNDESQSHISQ